MNYGRGGFLGIAFVIFHLIAAGALLYYMYTISKTLKKISKNVEKKSLPLIEGNLPKQVFE